MLVNLHKNLILLHLNLNPGPIPALPTLPARRNHNLLKSHKGLRVALGGAKTVVFLILETIVHDAEIRLEVFVEGVTLLPSILGTTATTAETN